LPWLYEFSLTRPDLLGVPAIDIVKLMIRLGERNLTSITQPMRNEIADLIVMEYNYTPRHVLELAPKLVPAPITPESMTRFPIYRASHA
jgi:hypothetical protein